MPVNRDNGLPLTTDGKIPFRLYIGVIGHRKVNEDLLRGPVQQSIEQIRQLSASFQHTELHLTAVSQLAEGADRVVASQILEEREARLEAVLPLPREDYLKDFVTPESRETFDQLLSRAARVTTLEARGQREDAYSYGGRYVVDHCDVLIAVWDGQPARGPGGTAETVEYAREQERPIFWIRTDRGSGGTAETIGYARQRARSVFWIRTQGGYALEAPAKLQLDSHLELEGYNRVKLNGEGVGREVERETQRLRSLLGSPDGDVLPLQQVCRWIIPFYLRADRQATHYRRQCFLLGSALFSLAAVAVIVSAVQAMLLPDLPQLAWVEVGLMVGSLGIVGLGQRSDFFNRWASRRFLAERFRSALFLALVGLRRQSVDSRNWRLSVRPSEGWLQRALEEVWSLRPAVPIGESDVEVVRRFLTRAWIDHQRAFHEAAAKKQAAWHRWLGRVTAILLIVTIIVAILHVLGPWRQQGDGGSAWAQVVVVFSISLPAVGAAISGVRAQQDYQWNAERSNQIAYYLSELRDRMARASDLQVVRAMAAETETVMLEENRDWFVLKGLHDFEVQM
jgi:hypothetical protein